MLFVFQKQTLRTHHEKYWQKTARGIEKQTIRNSLTTDAFVAEYFPSEKNGELLLRAVSQTRSVFFIAAKNIYMLGKVLIHFALVN